MVSVFLHLNRAHRAQVGLEHILQALASVDVDLQSFAPPLFTISFGFAEYRHLVARTRDSALGLRSCAADIFPAAFES
jgi:hypothetical protein